MVNADWVTSKIMSLISGLKTHTHDASKITSGVIDAARLPDLSASDIKSGVFEVARIPPVALERLVVVADDTARYALTTDTVQSGDTVKVTSSGYMYLVVDDTHLDTAAGYAIYTAGGIDAGQIISGTIDAARLPTTSVDDMPGYLTRPGYIAQAVGSTGVLVKSYTAQLVATSTGSISSSGDVEFTIDPSGTESSIQANDIFKLITDYAVSSVLCPITSKATVNLGGVWFTDVYTSYDVDDNVIDTKSLVNEGTGPNVTINGTLNIAGAVRVTVHYNHCAATSRVITAGSVSIGACSVYIFKVGAV